MLAIKLQLPAEVTVYYPSQTGWVKANLAVQWDAVPEHATAQEGSFEVLGHVLGTDLTTKMQVTVVTKVIKFISENPSNNATDSKAFASTTMIHKQLLGIRFSISTMGTLTKMDVGLTGLVLRKTKKHLWEFSLRRMVRLHLNLLEK